MSKVKVIFHVDMNAYFCGVEEIKYPFLKGKPFIVSSSSMTKGVVSTASYAARAFGVRSAMSKIEAFKLCPQLMIVKHDMESYEKYSHRFMTLLHEYTDIIEQASIDEAYMDMTILSEKRHPLIVAKEIQTRIKEEIGLSCSIGIGPNLFLAKMGSDFKKPMGITVIRIRDIKTKLYPLAIGDVFGIGKKSAKELKDIGIATIGDFMNYSNTAKLINVLGNKHYSDVIQKLTGKTSSEVLPNRHGKQSSLGHSRTFTKNLWVEEDLKEQILLLSKMVAERMYEKNLVGSIVSIQIRYSDFTNIIRSRSVSQPVQSVTNIFYFAEELFDEYWTQQPVRLLGVTVGNLEEKSIKNKHIDLFEVEELEREQRLQDAMSGIKKKYGEKAIQRKKDGS